jgi:hypothetical protein
MATAAANTGALPDVRSVSPDLVVPALSSANEGRPGVRTRLRHRNIRGDAEHILYLPQDWRPLSGKGERRYPVLVELAGNGPYEDGLGDVSTGHVEGSSMGFGLSGGVGCIWLCLPYLDDLGNAVRQWWGSPPEHNPRPTVDYAIRTVRAICQEYFGDSERVVLMGFSRGAIACNFIGLHDPEIASLWCGFLAFSHYDGVQQWPYPRSGRQAATRRLVHLGKRPQLIMSEDLRTDLREPQSSGQLEDTRRYLEDVAPLGIAAGQFTFTSSGFRNHNDTWSLRPCAARQQARAWLSALLRQPIGVTCMQNGSMDGIRTEDSARGCARL